MAANHKSKMGEAARLPKGVRKHVRVAKARIWAEVSDPETRIKRLNAVFAGLGFPDPEKARKLREKARKRKPKKKKKKPAPSE